jgi:tetratricopeptide (TPR) repeat protein
MKIFKILKYSQTAFILAILSLTATSIVMSAEAASLNDAQIAALYTEAKDFFKQADEKAVRYPEQAQALYSKAAMRYERIIREGEIRNGKLFYNLGNVYFRMNDVGRAILNYRRAMLYTPNDSNLKQNLAYAREKRRDQIGEKQETQVLKTLFFWHYDLSKKVRVIAFAVSFALIWIFACIRIFTRRPFLVWYIASAGVLSLLFVGPLVAEEISFHKTRAGVITAGEVVARKGNSETYEPSFKEPLHAGTEFVLLEERGNWLNIELSDSRTCWVPTMDIDLVK